jgi:hypothetical protein
MDDELLARLAALIGVMHARVDERLLHPIPIDVDRCMVGVLLDDREQVSQQPLLGVGQLGAVDGVPGGLGDAVDRGARLGNQRGRGVASLACATGGSRGLFGP